MPCITYIYIWYIAVPPSIGSWRSPIVHGALEKSCGISKPYAQGNCIFTYMTGPFWGKRAGWFRMKTWGIPMLGNFQMSKLYPLHLTKPCGSNYGMYSWILNDKRIYMGLDHLKLWIFHCYLWVPVFRGVSPSIRIGNQRVLHLGGP